MMHIKRPVTKDCHVIFSLYIRIRSIKIGMNAIPSNCKPIKAAKLIKEPTNAQRFPQTNTAMVEMMNPRVNNGSVRHQILRA